MNDKEWLKEKNEALARLGVHWIGNTLVKIGGMKLSEYLHSKMGPSTAVTWLHMLNGQKVRLKQRSGVLMISLRRWGGNFTLDPQCGSTQRNAVRDTILTQSDGKASERIMERVRESIELS